MRDPAIPRRRAAAQSGFSLLEILIGGALLAIALLGHTASIFNEHKLSSSERARSTALLAAEQVIERMRSDADWPTTFERFRNLMAYAESSGPAGPGVPLEATTGFAALEDGRKAFLPSAYYPDLAAPSTLLSFHVLVQVPAAPDAADPYGPRVLREDVPMPEYGLPHDLNGDGVIDADSHLDDFIALPLILTIRWTHAGGGEFSNELHIPTWLWGHH